MDSNVESLSEKIQALTPRQLEKVEEFIASMSDHGTALGRASAAISEPAFAAIWNNPEDDVYDAL